MINLVLELKQIKMESFKQPSELKFTCGNVAENWRKWLQKFENYMIAAEKHEKPDKNKIAILLNLLGDEGVEIYNTFKFEEGTSKDKYHDVIQQFNDYCSPRRNVVFERYKFFSCVQQEGQNVDAYLTQLKTLASTCEFGDQEEGLIRDRIVLGIRDNSLQERLLREPSLTLKKAADFLRASETSKEHLKTIKEPTVAKFDVHAMNLRKTKNKFMNSELIYCSKCGKQHKRKECPAYGKSCAKCKQKNHFAAVCRSSNKVKKVNELVENQKDNKNVSLYIDSVKTESTHCNLDKCWFEVLNVEGNVIQFKLDTGAEANVLPLSLFHSINVFNQIELEETNVVLLSYGNFKLKPEGKALLKCSSKKGVIIKLDFLVVDIESKPILGLKACQELNLIERVDQIKVENKADLVALYEEVFAGLGSFPGEPYSIVLKDNVTPVINPPRRVPLALHDKLKRTLEQLEQDGIIAKVNKPTDWVNSLVIVEKQNGSLRICLDPRNLNKAIKREHHMIPSADDIISRLEGKQVFSVLDLKDGFWQIPLDDVSSELCTFNSPFGRYRFKRMPFGIASAPEVFQKRNQNLFGDIPGVEVYFDDIIVTGSTLKEHDDILIKVLERAKMKNVKFNKDKFQYRISEVKYMGHIISKEGIKADPDQVKAIKKMEAPSSKADVRRLLGMLNFLSKFIPNLSKVTAPLRNLLKNDVEFSWDCEQELAFKNIKSLLSTTPVLKVFNSSSPIVIQCDSSKDGLGTCLIQDGHPVSFVSRSLTETEKNYAQIEKELLAIVFSFERFHNFVYGRKVTVQSDHKPLLAIVNKPISKISTRLQRMLLKLLKYEFSIQYIPGSQMYLADTLSRAFIKDKVKDDPEMVNMVHVIAKHLPISESRMTQFKKALQDDIVLQTVVNYCLEGWPKTVKAVPVNTRHYFKIKNDLQIEEGLLFLNNKIVVPKALRKDMLTLIHEAHFGIEKCKNRARELMYWPGMSRDIEDTVLKCTVCEKFKKTNTKEPLHPHAIPERPFEKIGIDLMEFRNVHYLVLIDYYSKWIEIEKVNNKSINEIKQKLKLLFAKFGIPCIIVSDNSPFNSFEFKSFAKEWDFECVFVSPRYPQSNGMVERAVGISKLILKKAHEEGKDGIISLMEYRNTPISGLGLSPAQLFFNRRLRTKLPISSKLLNAEIFKNINAKLRDRQKKQKYYYDKTSSNLKPLQPGETVYVQNEKNKTWEIAKVVAKDKNPRAYIVKLGNGKMFRRNRKFIRQTKCTYTQNSAIPYIDLDIDVSCETPDSSVNRQRTQSHSSDSNITSNYIPYKTRSGRIVGRPKHLKDFVC